MLKNLSFLALAGALAFVSTTGCILVTDDTATTTATTSGDGDGDTSTTGDGDGDGTGDGDGDGTGDGDGDGAAPACGWIEDPSFPGYYCDGSGEDPSGMAPIACPDGLVEGDDCSITGLSGAGCCDANGDNWYCGDDGMGGMIVVFDACGA